MKLELPFAFRDGPLDGLDITIEVDVDAAGDTAVRVWVAGPADGKPNKVGDTPYWSASYGWAEKAKNDYEVFPLKLDNTGTDGWITSDGPLLVRPKVDMDDIDTGIEKRLAAAEHKGEERS